MDDDLVAPLTGYVMGGIRPCRDCTKPVRPSVVAMALRVPIEPWPVPADTVPPQLWAHAWHWDNHRTGWSEHHGRTCTTPTYLAHFCGENQPAREGDSMTQFGTPKPPGDHVSADELQGHPLLIKVTEIVRGMVTSNGTADAVRCEVVVLDTGAKHDDALLFGKVLVTQFEAGVTYLGSIGKGVAQPGKSAPWLFTDGQGDPAALQLATGYLAHVASTGPAAAPAAAPAFVPPQAAPAAAPAAAGAPPWA